MHSETDSASPKKWITHKTERICETRVFNVLKKTMMNPGGKSAADFFTLEAPDWVNVVALDIKGDVILVEQYRHGTDKLSLEIPGGVIEKGVSPLVTAKRELREETGFVSGKWTNLGAVSSNPALFNNYCHVFLAEECRLDGKQQLDEHEDICVRKMSYYDFCESTLDGRIDHALAVAALAKYQVYRNREYNG